MSPNQAPREERFLLLILSIVQFCHICDFVILMPLGPQLMRQLGLSASQFSLLVSSYTWSAGVAGVFMSLLADRFDRKKVLLWGYLGFLMGTALCGLAQGYWGLLVGRVVAGAFGGSLTASSFAIVTDTVPVERRGAATGVLLSAFSVASVIGVPAGLALANWANWGFPFLALAALATIIWALAWWKLPSQRAHLGGAVGSRWAEMRQVVSYRPHLWAFGLSSAVMASGFIVIPFISAYLVGNVGLAETELPYVYFVGGCCTFFTSRWLGRLADRHGALRTFYLVAALSTVPMIALTHLPRVGLYWALPVTAIFFILVSGRWVPGMALITTAAHPKHRGAFLSLNASVQQLALGLASAVSGSLISRGAGQSMVGLGRAGWVAVGLLMASLVVARKLSKLK